MLVETMRFGVLDVGASSRPGWVGEVGSAGPMGCADWVLFPQASMRFRVGELGPVSRELSELHCSALLDAMMRRLNRLAWHPQTRWLGHSATAKMAPAIQGASGRVYLHGQMLQRHLQDERLSVFKAEYVVAGLVAVSDASSQDLLMIL